MYLQQRLEKHREKNLWRTREAMYSLSPREISTSAGPCLNFSSNDYLGLSHHPAVKESMIKAVELYGAAACASPFTGGYHVLHEALEESLKSWLQVPYVIVFSNGYLANTGVLQALTQRHGSIVMDRLAHASLVDGAQLSAAKLIRFPHQDLNALKNHLEQQRDQPSLVVSEGVYSMDGDISDLPKLSELADCQKNNLLYIDDAHGIGVLAEGRGSWHHHHMPANPNAIIMGTLSKALGSAGAFVACFDETIYQNILQFTRTYLFNTALSPLCAAASIAAIDTIQKEPQLLLQLNKNIQFFKTLAQEKNLPLLNSQTPIQPLIIGEAHTALALSRSLKEKNIWLQAIRPPTVPTNKSRLRITLNAHHTQEDLTKLIFILSKSL